MTSRPATDPTARRSASDGVRVGVHLGQQHLTMPTMRGLWERFDECFDWISAWDHLYEAPPAGGTGDHFEALTVLGALAATTRRARLGCLVFYVGYRTPGVLAKAATTLDHLSDGRFELGLGAGWHEPEMRAFGYPVLPVGVRLDMLDEATRIIRSLLSQPRTTFEGRHFRVDDASCLPAPVQERLPIWIGGVGERRTLRLVAELADGWNTAYVSVDEFTRLSGVLDGWCATAGRDPSHIRRGVNLLFGLSSTAERARKAADDMGRQWGPLASRVADGALTGTPDSALDRLRAYRAAGAHDINIALRAPWDDDALRAYIDEVLPAFRAESAAG